MTFTIRVGWETGPHYAIGDTRHWRMSSIRTARDEEYYERNLCWYGTSLRDALFFIRSLLRDGFAPCIDIKEHHESNNQTPR